MVEKKLIGEEKGLFDLHKMVSDMLQFLNKRQRDVIIKRYNLDGHGVKTLDGIGKEYNITRERVRQIEVEAIHKLKEVGKTSGIEKVFDFIKKIIEENGGLIGEDFIISFLFEEGSDEKMNKNVTSLILDLDDSIQKSKESLTSNKFYFYESRGVEIFEETIKILEKYFEENNQSLDFDALVELLRKSIKKEGENSFSHNSIRSYLNVNKVVLENILGEWGHHKWPHINPKSVKDKSYLTLKKENKPLHFTEITEKINSFWQNKKSTNSQTVHNELIKDGRFVLIGRGIYALKEWGYRPGVVLDVIIDVMKEKGGTMDQESVVGEVMKKRQVKRNTVILNLQNKDFFEKLPNKIYRLK
jgi:hypothetical protein